jgi:PTS system mannitol-specific IIC component
LRARLQQVGGFLAGMVIPNVGAFIAWGFITALFIPSGWLPNPHFARLVEPMILYLLPILIGFSGGRLVHDIRGGVVGAVATMGVVVGGSIPMFIGAMVVGPLGGWVVKKFDERVRGRVPVGFEMLVANFSAGILGMALALAAYVFVQPVVNAIAGALGAGAQWITNVGLLPLIALFIEPGKVLFMNNAINHGVLAPLGVAQVNEAGKSIFFLLETNPGPGLGLLLAYWLFGKGAARQSSPGAIVIQFFGGIHEIYFPYVLINPVTILALIAGGVAANVIFVATNAGLVATPSPGSIFAEIAMAPRGGLIPVLLGIAGGALCSCLVAMPLVRRAGIHEADAESLDKAKELTRAMKAQSKGAPAPAARLPRSIVFACEAGMGSSVIGESILRRKLQEAGVEVDVKHSAVHEIQPSAEVVISHHSLTDRVRQVAPQATLYAVDDFINSPVYDELIKSFNDITKR